MLLPVLCRPGSFPLIIGHFVKPAQLKNHFSKIQFIKLKKGICLMKSTAKNYQGLKSFAGLALYLGCTGFGFRKIGIHEPLLQAAFVFKNINTQSNFHFVLNKIYAVNQVYMRRFYTNNKNNFVVLVNLPDVFSFRNPQQKKLYTKSLRAFVSCIGTAVQLGSNYNHPFKHLLNQSKVA